MLHSEFISQSDVENARMNAAQKWKAVLRRDDSARERFFYAVKTTHIFCKPGCASRTPRRENVEFFSEAETALAAGYRACKRCEPAGDPLARRVLMKACDLLLQEARPSTAQLSRVAGLSPSYLVRFFKKHLGVTPQAWRRRALTERARASLASSQSVSETLFNAGYSSSSRFYESVGRELGMRPSRARTGAAGELISFSTTRCSLGWVLIAWTVRGVCDVAFGDSTQALEDALRVRFHSATVTSAKSGPWLKAVLSAIDGRTSVDLPLDIRGTAFQQRVWTALREIPPGETRTYLQVARELGNPKSVRAVARACAANSLAVVIPCHRVISSDQSLAGYRWGLKRKRALLEREKPNDV